MRSLCYVIHLKSRAQSTKRDLCSSPLWSLGWGRCLAGVSVIFFSIALKYSNIDAFSIRANSLQALGILFIRSYFALHPSILRNCTRSYLAVSNHSLILSIQYMSKEASSHLEDVDHPSSPAPGSSWLVWLPPCSHTVHTLSPAPTPGHPHGQFVLYCPGVEMLEKGEVMNIFSSSHWLTPSSLGLWSTMGAPEAILAGAVPNLTHSQGHHLLLVIFQKGLCFPFIFPPSPDFSPFPCKSLSFSFETQSLRSTLWLRQWFYAKVFQ